MKIFKLELEGVLLIENDAYHDFRGYFIELFSTKKFQASGLRVNFVQDNISYSHKNVFRGLHYQVEPFAQSKLITVLKGKILDVVVDIRKNSPTFKKHIKIELDYRKNLQLFIPKGFAHGFLSLSNQTLVYYKTDNFYSPEHERGLIWNDPSLKIKLPVKEPVLSLKDKKLPTIDKCKDELF